IKETPMLKISLNLLYLFVAFFGITNYLNGSENDNQVLSVNSTSAVSHEGVDSLITLSGGPSDLIITPFTGPDLTPSPACMAVAPTGEVFVGVDMMGSLGKSPGKGHILKLVDKNNDGKLDHHTVFAEVDNPRGITIL